MIVYDKEQKQIVIPNGLGNVNIIINQGCDDDKPTPPQDGWGMTGYFNNWGATPDIPFEDDGEWEGRPYKVIRNFEATGGEFKIRRNNAWTNSYTASFYNIPQFAKLIKGDLNMSINDGVWDIYLFFRNDGEPNEMLILHPGTDLSTIQYEYTLTISTDKENAIIDIDDSYEIMGYRYYGYATVPMKYGCTYTINVSMEGYENISDEITCYNDEERNYILAKIEGGGGCNLINPIVFSKEAGNTINAENVQIPTFVYEGNQYYNVDSFNLADIEEFKIHILFKPNNGGYGEPVNIFGCEDTDWDNTTFGARIYEGHITFRMSGEEIVSPYTENAWYDVEMGYNTTKRWVIVNGETLLDAEYTSFNRPSKTLMIGAINSGGNAFRPFYGKIAAIYIKSNGNQVYLLPKEDGTMNVYWNNRDNIRNSISGDNNARFENEYLSGDGMKSITWLGNLEDKWVIPSMNDRDSNGYIVVSPSEGYSGLRRTVINPQTIYNEGVEAGKAEGGEGGSCNLGVLDWALTSPSTEVKNASDDGYDGYSQVTIRPENIIAQEKENAINDFKNKMDEITITENGTYSIDDQETKQYIEFDGNSYFDSNIPFGENTKIEVAILKTTYEEDEQIIGVGKFDLTVADTYGGFGIVLGAGLAYGAFGKTKTTNIGFSMEEEQILTLDRSGIHSSYGGRTGGWIDDSKLDASNIYGTTIGIGKINSISDGWLNRGLKGRIRYVKIWTNKDDDSTMTLFRPKNMTQGAFDVVNSEGVETGHIENLGSGTATFVEENVKKYPYGFKRVEVNVPDLNGSYNEGYNQGKTDGINEQKSKLESISITENGVYSKEDGYNHIEVNVSPQMEIEEFGLNVWYYDLKRITDENELINSDWDLALQGETIENVFPGIAFTISGQAVAKPFFIDKVNGNSTATKIGKLVSSANGTPVSCAVVIIGAFECKNIETVDSEAFKYMTDLCYIDGMNGLGEWFISPQTIDFTYCTNLFIKTNSRKYISNFAESLFDLSAGNKHRINTSTLKFKSAVQERSQNADAIALMRSKGWTVEFV